MSTTNRRFGAASMMTLAVVAVAALGLPAAGALPASEPPPSEAEISPTVVAELAADGQAEVIVELATRPGPSGSGGDRDAAVAALAAEAGVEHARVLETAAPTAVATVDEAGLAALADSPDVARVLPDRRHYLSLASSTASVGAPAAWTTGFTGAGQRVAVLDTGVDADHAFLAGRVTDEACFSSTVPAFSLCEDDAPTAEGPGSAAPCPFSACNHGTHVAGIVAGSGGPTNAPAGVAPGASIIAVQVFSRDLAGLYASDSSLMQALDWVLQRQLENPNVAAVNLSLGGSLFTGACNSDPLRPYVDQLRAAGTATVIASGNEGAKDRLASPGCIPKAITVGATDDANNRVASFSNSAAVLDLLAPGVSIVSSVPGGGYQSIDGTSMATPHVAGAIAVLQQARDVVTVDEAELMLERAGIPVTDTNGLTRPRLRVDRAITDLASFGSIDSATGGPGSISAAGWIIDPDTTGSVDVELRVDGIPVATVATGQFRPDVGGAYPGYGNSHGWQATLTGIGAGNHELCAYGVNQIGTAAIAGGPSKHLISCQNVAMPSGNPFGSFDNATGGPRSIVASGWAIDPDTTGPVEIHTYVDGRWGGLTTASTSRPDVGGAYAGYGSNHGWQLTIGNVGPGAHQVCAYAINQAGGTTNPLIACRNVVVPSGNPFGSLDGATGGAGTVTAAGWAIDPDTAGSVQLHVYVDGRWTTATTANTSRPDVGNAYPGFGANHGFQVNLTGVAAGSRRLCVYAINVSAGTTNPLIACRNVTVSGST
jgi:subtilisin family serine protease